MPKRTKVDKNTYIVISILGTTSGGGAEKENCSAETEKIGAENAKIQSAEKSAETGGNRDLVMADRGFTIHEAVALQNAKCNSCDSFFS